MTAATTTAIEHHPEAALVDAAWQLAQRALGALDAGASRVGAMLASWRLSAEGRRSAATVARMSAHQLRDIGLRQTDIALLAAGATPRRGEY